MNLGFPEMMFIFILALILFGPKKLPEIGRQIGKGLAEFKRASREFQSQIEDEVRKLEIETDMKNFDRTIAPTALTNTVPSKSATLTVGSTLDAAPSEEVVSASTPELTSTAAHTDSTTATVPLTPNSAGNA